MVEQEIKQKLRQIEQNKQVKILLAVESGSRAWGFPSPDSDYDVRFIYVHDTDWYLQLFDLPDVIELAINDELDINGWDLKKALSLGVKGNATLFEWLNSPVVYRAHSKVGSMLIEGVNNKFNARAAFYHYVSLAKKFCSYLGEPQDEVKLKRFFYLLRALLCADWIRLYGSIPPVEFQKLLDDRLKTQQPKLYQAIIDLRTQKAQLDESGAKVLSGELRALVQNLYDGLRQFDFATHLAVDKTLQGDWNGLFRRLVNEAYVEG